MEKHSFEIPKGCKATVTQENGRLVVEIESEKVVEFKEGDIIFSQSWVQDYWWIMIIKSVLKIDKISYHALTNKDNMLVYDDVFSDDMILATDEQKQILFDALAKDGKKWNPEKKCIEPLKHIPKKGDFVKFSTEKGTGYFICGEVQGNEVYSHSDKSWIGTDGYIYYKNDASIGIPFMHSCIFETITKEQFQKEINDLGYEYDFENDTIEKLKWVPKKDYRFYRLCIIHGKFSFVMESCYTNEFDLGNINIRTKSEAQQLCDKLNTVLNEK